MASDDTVPGVRSFLISGSDPVRAGFIFISLRHSVVYRCACRGSALTVVTFPGVGTKFNLTPPVTRTTAARELHESKSTSGAAQWT